LGFTGNYRGVFTYLVPSAGLQEGMPEYVYAAAFSDAKSKYLTAEAACRPGIELLIQLESPVATLHGV